MFFVEARPVWGKGLQEKMNITCGFYATVARSAKKTTLSVATSGFYRVFVNGVFTYYGPIRCAHGHYRVDELDLTAALTQPANHIAVEVVNYYATSFSSLRQPGFIQAELRQGDTVVAATGVQGFSTFLLHQRLCRMQRYSFQRPFAESYRLHADTDDWRIGLPSTDAEPLETEPTAEKTLLPRELPLHTFPVVDVAKTVGRGTVTVGDLPASPRRGRSLIEIQDGVNGYTMEKLDFSLTDEVQRFTTVLNDRTARPYDGKTVLADGECAVLALPGERAGLLAMQIACTAPVRLWLLFDEILKDDGTVDPLRLDCANAISLELAPGCYHFQTFEPIGLQYLQPIAFGGTVTIENVHMREVVHPLGSLRRLDSDDAREQAVFAAAWQTFRHNAPDIFFDCPTRERAGWLCDSFFIGRSAQFFTGDTRMERQFMQNFLLPEKLPDVPEGMLPMCYPSDHLDGAFIVNWAMWYVVELYDYFRRTGDRALVDEARPRMTALAGFLRGLENADGLLEHIPGWVFVEWSRANDLVQDVNFPSNMHYAYVLRVLGELYGDASMTKRGEALVELLRRRAYNGTFFYDNDVYRDGKLVPGGEVTETCQYYAFYFDIATPDTHPELWKKLTEEFGPQRGARGLYPEVWPSNAFIGNYLRLELLLRYGRYAQVRQELVGYFYQMTELTGTLWENMSTVASCDHGFASYAACLLDAALRQDDPYRDLRL